MLLNVLLQFRLLRPIKLKTVQEGEKDAINPRRFFKVSCYYKLYYSNSNLIIEDKLDMNRPVTFKLGDGSVPNYIEQSIVQLKMGEKSIFQIPESLISQKNPKDANTKKSISNNDLKLKKDELIFLEINLTNCTAEEPEKYDIEDYERIKYSRLFKEKATIFFKEKKLAKSLAYFKKALAFIEWDKDEDSKKLKIMLLNNISFILTKMNRSKEALEGASLSIKLSPQNPKSYFRRGCVFLNLQLFDKAVKDFIHANQLEPQNKMIISSLNKARKMKKNYVRENFKMFKNVLGKDIYQENIRCEYSDNLNKNIGASLSIFIGKKGGQNRKIRVELFENIVPEAVNFFRDKIVDIKYSTTDVKAHNFISFAPEKDEFGEFYIDNCSIKVKSSGFLYFTGKKIGSSKNIKVTALNISLALLPWLNDKSDDDKLVAVFGIISHGQDWIKQINDDNTGLINLAITFCV